MEYINNIPRTQSGSITQDSVWTNGNGDPYIITDILTIEPEVKLIIQQGVTLKFDGGKSIHVRGILDIRGSQGNEVLLTANTATPIAAFWSTIYVRWQGDLKANFATIEYADLAVLFEAGTTGTLTNSTLRNCNIGLYLTAIESAAFNPVVSINQSALYNNTVYNYWTFDFGDPDLTVLDARDNWWGVSAPTAISATILDRNDGTDSTDRPWVDYGGYLDGPSGNPVTGATGLVGTVGSNTTYPADNYELLSTVTIISGVTVNVEPGATFFSSNNNFGWHIQGTLNAQGTVANPVVFTSDAITPSIGDWPGMYITWPGNLILNQAVIEYADQALVFDSFTTGLITNSTIRFNDYGIHVLGSPTNPAQNPTPIINYSELYGNTTHNYFTTRFSEPDSAVLDARFNWWGTLDTFDIEDTVYHRADDTVFDAAWVDYSQFLASEDGPVAFGIALMAIDDVIANPTQSDTASLYFKTNTTSTSRVRIYTVNGSTILNEFTQAHSGPEAVSYVWDGQDDQSQYVADGVYRMELYVTDGPNEITWDPDTSDQSIGNGVIPTTFNTYQNEFVKVDFTIEETGTVSYSVTPQGESAFWFGGAYEEGTHQVVWDGRRPDGSEVSGPATIFFSVPVALRRNSVIVEGSKPRITGTVAAPNVEVKSDPYLITQSYEQFSTIAFRLDQDANVTFKLLPPGVYDPANPSAIILINNELRQAESGGSPIDHVVQWSGHDGIDTNDILVSEEGPFTFTIEATSVFSGQTSLYRGSLQIQP